MQPPLPISDMRMRKDFSLIREAISGHNTVYFEPLRGNNGDHLIRLGACKLLESLDVQITARPEDAEAIIINGGGGMTRDWGFLSIVENYVRTGARNIVILPSSIDEDPGRLANLRSMAESINCNITIFVREKYSFDRLKSIFTDLYLSHDMAFILEPGDLGYDMGTASAPYTLIVERRDAEASTAVQQGKAYPIPGKRMIPAWAKRPVKRYLFRRDSRETSFARQCIEAEPEGQSIASLDVSSAALCSFNQFLRMVGQAERVYTTRLHVGILRYILNRPCFIKKTGGSYRKNEAVYENSMSDNSDIRLI